jgi:hypothetical protein
VAWIVALGLVGFVVFVLVSAEATRRILVVDVEAGQIVKLEGRAPADLTSDVEDVLRRSGATGQVVLRLEASRIVVRSKGALDETTMQRLRNVVGRFPVARLRTARRVRRRRR